MKAAVRRGTPRSAPGGEGAAAAVAADGATAAAQWEGVVRDDSGDTSGDSAVGEETEAAVGAAWASYQGEMARLFEAYKGAFLPREVAAKGLRVIWLGEKPQKAHIGGARKRHQNGQSLAT